MMTEISGKKMEKNALSIQEDGNVLEKGYMGY